MYTIKCISYEEIYPLWVDLFGVENAEVKIERPSYLGLYNHRVPDKLASVTFLGIFNKENELCGVNSIYKSLSEEQLRYLALNNVPKLLFNKLIKKYSLPWARSRGLYILPKYRKLGLGTLILRESCNYFDVDAVWSIPRKEALSTYISCGFKQTSPFSFGNIEGYGISKKACYALYKK